VERLRGGGVEGLEVNRFRGSIPVFGVRILPYSSDIPAGLARECPPSDQKLYPTLTAPKGVSTL